MANLWTANDVATWLKNIGLEELAPNFIGMYLNSISYFRRI